MYKLTGNGMSYLTASQQKTITDSSTKDVRFMSQHGLVAWDGDSHLYAGDRIVATWDDSPPPAPPSVAVQPMPERPIGLSDNDWAVIGHAVDQAVEQAILRVFARLHEG